MSFRKRNAVVIPPYEQGELITEQAHAEHHDINYIIDQYTRTGVLAHNDEYSGQYGDFTRQDFEEAQMAVAEANQFFDTLPQAIRQEFPGGTAEWLEFVSDPENAQQLEAYGLDASHLGGAAPVDPASDPVIPEPAPVNNDDDNDDDD